MDYLQYDKANEVFNMVTSKVLNLIINGLPSILEEYSIEALVRYCFKPYYKWITFNIKLAARIGQILRANRVLNLIINGLPSIFKGTSVFNR